MPPVVPSMGAVLDWAFLAEAAKDSMVRDLFVAGLHVGGRWLANGDFG